MELLKKKFLLKETATLYTFNILLTATIKDWGFFDSVDQDAIYYFGTNNPIGLENLL